MTIILDLDNCIRNDAWRIRYIHWDMADTFDRYHDYHLLAPFDEPGNHALFSEHDHTIVIFTSTPEFYRVPTEEWLRRNAVPYKLLLMRQNDDHSPSAVVKEDMLMTLMAMGHRVPQDIAAAFDDRPDVVAMYRRHGIAAAQVRSIHNISNYERQRQ